jgi:predicted AlkP superfamily pyrophosphatase or phosphodiesterase
MRFFLKRFLIIAASVFTIVFMASFSVCTQSISPIKLVVVISVDQMRADYLTRFDDLYTGGFRYLLDNGAVFIDAYQEHSETETGVGHSTILTGLFPSSSGIVGNDWYDSNAHRQIYCVRDTTVVIIGEQNNRNGVSFKNVNGSTLGDWLKAVDKKAKVYSISRKDRAAVLLGGQHPDGVFWYNTSNGSFITSTAYLTAYPVWVEEFNKQQLPNRLSGTIWDRLLPNEELYIKYSRVDSFPNEARGGNSTKFPHELGQSSSGSRFYTQFGDTPRMAEYLIEFAKAIIQNDHLGKDGIVDVLAMSFSEADGIGHTYGPFSQEELDEYLRLDRLIGDFFTFLDKTIGLSSCVIVLTGDHGALPLPEYLQQQGIDSKRVRFDIPGLEKKLNDTFGVGRWIEANMGTTLYINRSLLQQYTIEYKEIEQFIANEISTWEPVARVYTRTELLERKSVDNDPYFRLYQDCFYPERSGNIFIRLKEFYLLNSSQYGTSHGSPYSYDTHVPLIFTGNQIVKGTYKDRVATADIAPTLARIIGIPIRGKVDGKVLQAIIR